MELHPLHCFILFSKKLGITILTTTFKSVMKVTVWIKMQLSRSKFRRRSYHYCRLRNYFFWRDWFCQFSEASGYYYRSPWNKQKLPKASAVINPKREDNEFSFKYLAGVGVAFLWLPAYLKSRTKRRGIQSSWSHSDRNCRRYCSFGSGKPYFREIRSGAASSYRDSRFEIFMFTYFWSRQKRIFTYDWLWPAPVFNAAGRLKDAKMVVKLTTDNKREIEIISKELISKNNERKVLQEKLLQM